jgi:hypothetical protein
MVQNNIRRSPFVVLYCGRDEVMCFCETCVLMGASQATHPLLLRHGNKMKPRILNILAADLLFKSVCLFRNLLVSFSRFRISLYLEATAVDGSPSIQIFRG